MQRLEVAHDLHRGTAGRAPVERPPGRKGGEAADRCSDSQRRGAVEGADLTQGREQALFFFNGNYCSSGAMWERS